jgi:hypothetical protein
VEKEGGEGWRRRGERGGDGGFEDTSQSRAHRARMHARERARTREFACKHARVRERKNEKKMC